MQNNSMPFISVCITAYNKELYVAQAIDSVLGQQINYSFEIVIGEDCSTDNTRNICIEYQKKYPEKIKLLLHEKNLGLMDNFQTTIQACKGKYIAILDADDYWIDHLKLQKQLDYIQIKKCALVHTAIKLRVGEKLIENFQNRNDNSFEKIILSNPIVTSTALGVGSLLQEAVNRLFSDKTIHKCGINDYPLWLEIAKDFNICFLNEATTVYRILDESDSHTENKLKSYLWHNNIVNIKDFFYKRYNKKQILTSKFKNHFHEMIFHARKRMLLNYGWVAREQILWLLLTNPIYYFYIIISKIKRKLKKINA